MRASWLLILLTCLPLAASAQDEPFEIDLDELSALEAGATVVELGDAVIDLGEATLLGERSLTNLLSDTRAVELIPAEAFGESPTLTSVLERVPGLDVRQQGGLGQLNTVQLRGARANQVLVLLDGAPLMQGASDLSLVPLPSIARVEVLRGPDAARFGQGALGGVLNIVTVQPSESTTPDVEITGELAGCADCPDDDWDYSMELGGGSQAAHTINITALRPDDAWGFSHLGAKNNYEFQRAGGDVARRRNNEVRQDNLWASWLQDGWQLRAGLDSSTRGVPGSAEFPTLQARLRRDGLWLNAAQPDRHFALNLIETRFTDPEPFLQRGAIDSRDTQLHAEYAWGSLASQRGSSGYKLRLDAIDSSGYGREVRAGLDAHWHHEDQLGAYLAQLDTGVVASSDIGVDPVARLGLSRQLSDTTQAYATVGYAMRHPGFDELYYLDTGGVRGNPELEPERVVSYEVGLKASLPAARLELAGFVSHYEDSIIWVPVSAYLVEARNTGRAKVVGVEALADIRLADQLWWRTAYTWLPTAEYATGVPLTGRAEQHANSRLEWLGDHYRAALSLDYTGDIPADLFGNLVIEPRTLVGAELCFPCGPGELGINVSNLFDESSRDSWNYPLPGREVFVNYRSEL